MGEAVGSLRLDPADPLSTLLTVEQAADIARVSPRTVNRWIAEGRLRALPGRRVVERDLITAERERRRARHPGRRGARPPHLMDLPGGAMSQRSGRRATPDQPPRARPRGEPQFRPAASVTRLDQMTPQPCPRCGYDVANDPDRLAR